MKKRIFALLCVLALLLAACTPQEAEPPEGAYRVYFAVSGEQAAARTVGFEYRTLPEGEENVEGLVGLLLADPQTAGLASPFLPGVRLNASELGEDGQLHLDLSEQYNGLPGIYLTVANACLVLTLTQLEGVESVYITVDGTPLPYQSIQQLRATDLVLSGGEEETVSVNAILYFPRAEGGSLGWEYRTVVKSEELGLPAAVLTALLSGPENAGLTVSMGADTVIYSAKAENGVCKVDLSQAFLDGAPQDPEAARLVLYSIVDTLCALEGLKIDVVQFYVEGQALDAYGGLSTLAPLGPDYSLAK